MTIKTEAEQAFDAVVQDHIACVLKVARFKKAALTWRKVGSLAIGVVQLQRDRWNTKNQIRFTMNLGAFFHEVHRADYPEAKWMWDKRPGEIDCHVRERIGFAVPTQRDMWWEIGSMADASTIGPAVAQLLEQYGVPWVERAMSDTTIPSQMIASRQRRGDQQMRTQS